MEQETLIKPPPIVLGVQGIAPKPITMNEAKADWRKIVMLPPFQMYAAECGARDGNAYQAAKVFLSNELSRKGDDVVWAEYCDWFEAKGYWANETPDGKLKGM